MSGLTMTWIGECFGAFPWGASGAVILTASLGLLLGVAIGQAIAMRDRMPHAGKEAIT